MGLNKNERTKVVVVYKPHEFAKLLGVTVFSCRLYGLRKCKSKIKMDKEVIFLGTDEKSSIIPQSNNEKGT